MLSNKTISIAVIIIVVIALASALYSWFKSPQLITKTEYVEVPQVKEVIKIQKVKVPVKEIVALEKEKVIEKLKLPLWIKADENKQVVATGVIEPYDGNTNVIGLIDTKTGESSIIAKQQPLKFIAFESIKEIGVRAGVSLYGPTGDIYGRWSFLRVGNFHGSIYVEGSASQDMAFNTKAMLDVRYQWK